ncbi:MAG: type Z 30S ribosomal protein S14 [Candidatus Caldipriscus sp.]|jgi:small subunit ribosomal protein S14|nr:type Z 30S ribosomal protein S14 [Candidatus Caldipriscus sp.]
MATKAQLEKMKKKPKYKTRKRNRCLICGRDHGFFRQFGICRICFRELALEGKLPGVIKASW